jgi:tRNA(fMet)-specific endonuclease VapC
MRGNKDISLLLDEAHEVFLTPVVVGELLAGFKNGSKEQYNTAVLKDFFSVSTVNVLSIDDSTAERYAVILAYLKKSGTPIPTNDIWIAATSMQHGLVLITADRHFSTLPQIVCEIVV